MNKTLAALVSTWLAGSAVPAAGAGDTIRCGGALVDPGMTAAEVEATCGTPDHKEIEHVPIRSRTAGGGSIEIGTTTIEHWIYERGLRLPARLTFEEDRLTRIERLTRR